MNDSIVDQSRRNFLTGASCVLGTGGIIGAAVPFIGSWQPSSRAQAAGSPVKIDISKLEEGAMITVEWRGKPVYILKRSETFLQSLRRIRPLLLDPDSNEEQQPDYVSGNSRTIKGREQVLVIIGICTHLGCTPKLRTDTGAEDLGGTQWLGGFFCPCHGSKFDLAGRVYKGAPAPLNLQVPPYKYINDDVIVIGQDEEII